MSLRAVSMAFVVASIVGLVAIPMYLDFSVANDSLRSVFDLGALVPLFRVTAFGRAIVDLWICFGLFCLAGWIALWLDRPQRERRSVAELIAAVAVVIAAAAVLVVPGAAGHAAQTAPRGLTLFFDWLHLAAGSVWFGGLVGLLVLWVTLAGAAAGRPLSRRRAAVLQGRARVGGPPRRDRDRGGDRSHAGGERAVGDRLRAGDPGQDRTAGRRAPARVGQPAALHPTPGCCPRTARPRRCRPPGCCAAWPVARRSSWPVPCSQRRCCRACAPPPPAFALENSAIAKVGPGRVEQTVRHAGYVLQVLVSPNKAAAPDSFALRHNQGRPAGARRRRDPGVQPPRDADAPAGIPAPGDPARVYYARWRPRW